VEINNKKPGLPIWWERATPGKILLFEASYRACIGSCWDGDSSDNWQCAPVYLEENSFLLILERKELYLGTEGWEGLIKCLCEDKIVVINCYRFTGQIKIFP